MFNNVLAYNNSGPGFSIWLRNFREIFTDEEANAELSEYVAQRIRGRVHDPVVAEKLVPKDTQLHLMHQASVFQTQRT